MRRRLGGFESAEAWSGASYPYNAVAVLRLRGRPGAGLLTPALAELQARHPLLRARLERQGSGWEFAADGAAPIPLRQVGRAGEEDWRAVAEEELNTAMDGAAPLVRCALVAPPTAGPAAGAASELVLAFHHAIVDAASMATVCRELLELYGGVPRGEAPRPAELPPRPEARFPARFRGRARHPRLAAFLLRRLAEEASYLWRSRGVRSPPPASSASCRVLPVSLDEAPTAALVRACRRRRVTLNGALNAALLLAVHQRRYDGRRVPLRYFAFPDLRPYLEPPIEPGTVGSYLTTMRFTLGLESGERFWPLAARVDRQLYRSFRRGEKFLFCLTSAGLLRALLRLGKVRFGSAAVSYTGPLELPREVGELGLRGVHGFVSNMPIGAELTAQTRLFRGRLWWDFVYLDADLDEGEARALAGEVLARLEEAADERH